ncbi:MAG: transcriptional repressor [SAR202 cluster bacterium]|jgi:Fur family ferric uptake transcriptional regulator|nr:transcriptional repressor [SAR202 cluster bacterium]
MVASQFRPDLMSVIEDMGYRITQPRRDVVKLLETKPDGFGAEEINAALPDVGRATVYRTIRLLLDIGVICKLVMRDGSTKYSLARVEHHHHLVCVRCGTVEEFLDSTIERLVRAIGAEVSGEILGHRIEFDVICKTCLDSAN